MKCLINLITAFFPCPPIRNCHAVESVSGFFSHHCLRTSFSPKFSEIESEESAAKQKMSEETKKTKTPRAEKPDAGAVKAKSSSVSTSKEAAASEMDADAAAATAAAPTSKEAKQAAIRAAAKQGAILAAKAAKPKYVKPAGKGNWLPIHEYYYGRKSGDPAYVEQKGEFRFKCWHCEKMLYNNLKVRMERRYK